MCGNEPRGKEHLELKSDYRILMTSLEGVIPTCTTGWQRRSTNRVEVAALCGHPLPGFAAATADMRSGSKGFRSSNALTSNIIIIIRDATIPDKI